MNDLNIIVFLSDHWLVISSTATAMLMITVTYTISHALVNVRTSQATVAWTVGLISLPIVALPLYWVLARNRFPWLPRGDPRSGVPTTRLGLKYPD